MMSWPICNKPRVNEVMPGHSAQGYRDRKSPKTEVRKPGPFVALDHRMTPNERQVPISGHCRGRYGHSIRDRHSLPHIVDGILPRGSNGYNLPPRVSGILPLSAGLSKVRNYEAAWTGVVKL
jgi:hypothetical protein